MEKLGEHYWNQLSLWEHAPTPCVQTFVMAEDNKQVLRYYLMQVVDIVTDTHIRSKVVESVEGVPDDILNWRNGDISIVL